MKYESDLILDSDLQAEIQKIIVGSESLDSSQNRSSESKWQWFVFQLEWVRFWLQYWQDDSELDYIICSPGFETLRLSDIDCD